VKETVEKKSTGSYSDPNQMATPGGIIFSFPVHHCNIIPFILGLLARLAGPLILLYFLTMLIARIFSFGEGRCLD
jgi:hypothetical protein